MGIKVTQSTAEDLLRQNNYFKNQYQNIEQQYSQGLQTIQEQERLGLRSSAVSYGQNRYMIGQDFTNQMSNAYASSLQTKQSLMQSNVGTGYREQMALGLDEATSNAYDSYVQNYMMQRQDLQSQYQQNIADIQQQSVSDITDLSNITAQATEQVNELLSSEASNISAFANIMPEYYEYLAKNKPYQFITNKNLRDFYGNVKTIDDSGTESYEKGILPWSDISNQVYGSDGGLTDYGKQLFSAMMYDVGGNDQFDRYLEETNPELREWLMQGSMDNTDITNKEFVLQQLGMGGMGDKFTKFGEDTKFVNPYAATETGSYSTTKDFGDVKQYHTHENETLTVMSSLSTENTLHTDKTIKGQNFSAYYTDDAGEKRKYKFELTGEKAESNISADIENATGSLTEGQFYTYDDIVYIALDTGDGAIELYQADFRDNSSRDAWLQTIRNTSELQKSAEQEKKEKKEQKEEKKKNSKYYGYAGSAT